MTVKLEFAPLKLTTVVPLKPVPVMVMFVPAVALVGEKLVIAGATMTVNVPALVAVPPGVVTDIFPVVAPAGTVAVICVAELTVKVELIPLNLTSVAPVKFVPVITMLAPMRPLVGLKLVIVGAGMTVKLLALVAVPPGVVTLIGPVVAPVGTVAVI